MTGEPWFEPQTVGMVGGLIGVFCGLWGALVGTISGLLIPRGKGKAFVFAQLYLGLIAGVGLLGTGLTALITGQPYAVWYALLLPGVLLTLLSGPFLFMVRNRYRQVELRKMQAEEI